VTAQGESTRAIGEVLGVNNATVARDLAVANATEDAPDEPQIAPDGAEGVAYATPDSPEPAAETYGMCATMLRPTYFEISKTLVRYVVTVRMQRIRSAKELPATPRQR
jgi:hypothetical protein